LHGRTPRNLQTTRQIASEPVSGLWMANDVNVSRSEADVRVRPNALPKTVLECIAGHAGHNTPMTQFPGVIRHMK
jgi:hypothetical protein